MPEHRDYSENQLRLMAAIRDSESVQTTEMLGTIRTRERSQLGADAARKALGRLESRDPAPVRGEGSGKDRSWILTDFGVEVITELRPKREGEDATGVRSYVLLEETSLRGAIEALLEGSGVTGLDGDTLEWLLSQGETAQMYEVVGTVDARNTEHAFRQVAKAVYAARDTGWEQDPENPEGELLTVPTIAIDGKRWRPQPVKSRRSVTVSVG